MLVVFVSIWLLASAPVLAEWVNPEPLPKVLDNYTISSWVELTPGTNVFHANISLPKNYNNLAEGYFNVAINRVSATSEPKLGSLLVNPGGPGGSGTDFLYGIASLLKNVTESRYDLIGFDPRAVNLTDLDVNCFPRDEWAYIDCTDSPLPSKFDYADAALGDNIAATKLVDRACAANNNSRYVSSGLVVADMLAISRSLGDFKLNFWGFSYGTILGNTFAQMFPESVGRMIVDGNVDGMDYYTSSYTKSLFQIDDVFDGFFQQCAKAGSGGCALAKAFPDCEWTELRARVLNKLHELRVQSEQVEYNGQYGIVTYSDFKGLFFQAMYTPSSWPFLANVTAELLLNNRVPLFQATSLNDLTVGNPVDAGNLMTRCGDSSRRKGPSGSIDQYRRNLAIETDQSPLFGELWIVECPDYNTQPVYVWDGPFRRVNASMLVIGNTYDPVTPLCNAENNAKLYTDGVFLKQNGYGHCSVAQPSQCTHDTVRQWLVNGVLPAEGTVCQVDHGPFQTTPILEKSLPIVALYHGDWK